MNLLFCLLFLSSPAYSQWRPVVSSTITPQSINENFNRAAIWSNRKVDKYANETIRGKNTFTAGQTFSSTVTLPTRDKITFGDELHNSSSAIVAANITFTQTALAICYATATITTNGGSVGIHYIGTIRNDTGNASEISVGIMKNGVLLNNGNPLITVGYNVANARNNMSFFYVDIAPVAATHSYCLPFAVTNGNGITMNPGQFGVEELR